MKYGRATTNLHAKSNMHHQTKLFCAYESLNVGNVGETLQTVPMLLHWTRN